MPERMPLGHDRDLLCEAGTWAVSHRDLTADRLAMRIHAGQPACPHTRAVPGRPRRPGPGTRA
jgi:hypothetical protein